MPTQNTLLGTIIAFLIANPIVAILLASFLFSLVRNAISPPKVNPKDLEMQRRRKMLEEQLRQNQNNPQRAGESIDAYLNRTRPEKLEDHDGDGRDDNPDGLFKDTPIAKPSSGTANTDQSLKDFQADILTALGMKPENAQGKSAQDALRGQLAQKMGRTTPPIDPNSASATQTRRSQAKSMTRNQSGSSVIVPSNGGSSVITPNLAPEMTAQRVTMMTDSNAGVTNSSIQVKLERERSTTTSNSTRFGTTNDVVRGIIWSEILNKPKASRR
jgi:phosphate/sulfate permease